jgi:hypothetical protein
VVGGVTVIATLTSSSTRDDKSGVEAHNAR